MSLRRLVLAASALSMVLTSCISFESHEAYAAKRRQVLLEMYPVGKTTKKDIATRFAKTPDISATRPAKGWDTAQDGWVRNYAPKAERRIQRKIAQLERYYGADGLSSLCYCWFYYDSRDRLIDAEWQWSSN